MKPELTFLDWCVFSAVLLATFAAVLWGQYFRKSKLKRKKETFLDYLIMGRMLTLPLFIATLVATWYGGIFGVTQIAFENGIYNFITQGVFWYVTYLIFALFLVDRVKRYNAVTLPDLVGKLFGPLSARVAAVFNVMNVVPVAYVMALGLLLQTLFGLDFIVGMCVGTAIVLSYSMLGGLRAVVFSDLVQFFVMCASVALVLILSIHTYGGWDFLKTSLPESHFEFTGGESLLSTFAWGLIALSTLVDPNFYQRCFAAQSSSVAKKGILLSTLVWIAFDICTTAGGMYARAVLSEAESATAYLNYALQLLPDGLRGFFLAGIVATILSTMDSYIFVAGASISHDLAPARFRDRKIVHYVAVVLVGVVAITLGSSFDGNIKDVWKTLGSYSAACLLLPVMSAYLFPNLRISDRQFVVTCFAGVVATTYWRLTERSDFWKDVDELYIGIAATSVCLAISWMLRARFAPRRAGLST